ncbi:hypothetical protein AB0I16_34650 [Streptomyces sp. NPDC050703]|uniref:hypothetical protein n=1 Tax=Streptomyces sp. NPDC050703 TaxID=3157218 RepID=UPI003418CD9C
MPYLIPTRKPLMPEQVEQGFDYLLALQTGGGASVAGRADPELAFVLLRLAEDIVWPVTAVDGDAADLCADSFVLDEVGCVLLSALRDWARNSPHPDHEDTADTLEALRDAHLAAAHAVHSVPDAHR